jgi:hypothetical protein
MKTLFLVITFCLSLMAQTSLEQNSKEMYEKFYRDVGDKWIVELSSPDTMVTVAITKGEWFSETVCCNYIIMKNDSLFFTTRDRMVCRINNSKRDYIWMVK